MLVPISTTACPVGISTPKSHIAFVCFESGRLCSAVAYQIDELLSDPSLERAEVLLASASLVVALAATFSIASASHELT
jgi:hypothetical protein